ncbi:MAG: DNA translocase FtsK 4TM domain-containing protein [bacterium]
MSKEKKKISKEEEKIYFYEISATIVILFSLITFSELGFVGTGLKSLMLILFGDYYFVILLYLIGHGIYALIKRRWFNFTSIKFNGFLLFVLSLIALNHIGFYERLGFDESDIFSNTLTTFYNTIKNLIQINSYGGGLVGALVLQVLIFLFNPLGTLVILVVLLILSISFMTSFSYKTFMYYTNFVYKKIRTAFILMYKYFNNISFPTKQIKKAKLNVNLNINILDDVDNKANEAIAYKISEEVFSNLAYYLSDLGVYITNKKMYLGYNTTRYVFDCSKIVYEREKINSITQSNTIIYDKNNNLIIEASNKVKRLLTIKQLLLNTDEIPLGLEIDNSIITFEPLKHYNLLLTGSNDSGIKTYLKSFIVSNIFKYRNEFKLVLFDFNQDFIELKYMPNLFQPYCSNSSELLNTLDNVAKELERRIELINQTGYQNYTEHNKLETNKLEVIYVVINNIDNIKSYVDKQEAKLLYFLKFGFRVGIHFIIINRNIGIEKDVLTNVQTKLVFKCNMTAQSYEILNNNNGCLLESKADILISNLNETLRVATPYISNGDYDKVITKYIVN